MSSNSTNSSNVITTDGMSLDDVCFQKYLVPGVELNDLRNFPRGMPIIPITEECGQMCLISGIVPLPTPSYVSQPIYDLCPDPCSEPES